MFTRYRRWFTLKNRILKALRFKIISKTSSSSNSCKSNKNPSLHQRGLPLALVRHSSGVVPAGGRGLYDDQADGAVVGARDRVGGVHSARVLALAVVHHAGDEEDEEQDDVAGDKDEEVQRYRVDLHLVQHDGVRIRNRIHTRLLFLTH